MDPLAAIQALEGKPVIPATPSAWGPCGSVGVANAHADGTDLVFELLVPTSANDIWDYIWRSEKEGNSTEKVQLFQNGKRVEGSQIRAIRREGQDDKWDSRGPEQYRLTFTVPSKGIRPDSPVQVRFLWDDSVMSTAG
jgi:hypothetical protein